MGCNFYNAKTGEHIGKRSAAGPYCFDCGLTLCKGGEARVHYFSSEDDWHTECPRCGLAMAREGLGNSTMGLELGFNKNPYETKTGVRSCSSFSFAIPEDRARAVKKVRDEYGHEYKQAEFLKVLDLCPIKYNLTGYHFS